MIEKEIRALHPDRPRTYDITTDEFRFVTQADVEAWEDLIQLYGKIWTLQKEFAISKGWKL